MIRTKIFTGTRASPWRLSRMWRNIVRRPNWRSTFWKSWIARIPKANCKWFGALTQWVALSCEDVWAVEGLLSSFIVIFKRFLLQPLRQDVGLVRLSRPHVHRLWNAGPFRLWFPGQFSHFFAFQFLRRLAVPFNGIPSIRLNRKTTTTSRTRWIRSGTLATSYPTPFDSCTTTSWPTRTWSPKTFSLSTRTLTSPTTPKRWLRIISQKKMDDRLASEGLQISNRKMESSFSVKITRCWDVVTATALIL